MDTVAHFIERYRREVLPRLRPRTQDGYNRHLDALSKHFGHMEPNAVKPKDIGKFLDRPKGKIQANRQIAVLSAIYTKMVGRWYVADVNPCLNVERNPAHRRTRYVTNEEYAALYAFAKPRIRLAMDLALLTAQRQSDLISLPWSNVRPDGILFTQSKSGKRLLLGISPSLEAVLDRARQMTPPGECVIRTRTGKAYTSEGFRACWQRTMQRAMRKGILTERFTFHDLRAKSISDTASIHDAYDRAGHTSLAMTRGTYDRGIRKVMPLR